MYTYIYTFRKVHGKLIRRSALRETGVSRHHGAHLRVLKNMALSQHYFIEEFEKGILEDMVLSQHYRIDEFKRGP